MIRKIVTLKIEVEEYIDLGVLRDHIEFVDGVRVISSRTKYVKDKKGKTN